MCGHRARAPGRGLRKPLPRWFDTSKRRVAPGSWRLALGRPHLRSAAGIGGRHLSGALPLAPAHAATVPGQRYR